MNTTRQTGYSNSTGLQLLETAVQQYGPVFTMKQLKPVARKQELTDTHLRFLISSLASAGRIDIIKRGTYVVTSALFAGDVSPWAIAAALVQPMAVGYWSACAHHGFTTQNPVMVQAATPKKIVTPEMRKGEAYHPRGRAVWQAYGLEFEFMNVKPKYFWGFNTIWLNAWHQVNVMDPERTALDLIVRPDIFGGMPAAIGIMESALNKIETGRLVDYAIRYDTAYVIKRLGWVLDILGVPAVALGELERYPSNRNYKIDTTQDSAHAHVNQRWQIIENLRRG